MAEDFQGFHFKQFSVEHRHCAMKVGTDSILLGSWVQPGQARRILDIGTGSGLLALMMAQKTGEQSVVCGVDIDGEAVEQANANGRRSPWAKRLHFSHCDIEDYDTAQSFDLLIANPPYFPVPQQSSNAYHKQTAKRVQARRTDSLDFVQLTRQVRRLLQSGGRFACVLPVDGANALLPEARHQGMCLTRCLQVSAVSGGKVIRHCLEFVNDQNTQSAQTSRLAIRDSDNNYTEAYRELCKDYYLAF